MLESTILTVPPLSFVALIVDRGKEKGLGTWPCGSEGATLLVGGSTRIPHGQRMGINQVLNQIRTRGKDEQCL